MQPHDPKESFNQQIAARYDDRLRGDEDVAAAFLNEFTGNGAALEFAIGTGRIALPLAQTGARVDGIELSEAMVERLRSKPGGKGINVRIGDMASVSMGLTYPLVYLVFNTIFNIQTQEGQINCFRNAARHLAEDGVFVIEAAVPDDWLPNDSYTMPERVEANSVTLDVCKYDPVTQILHENHVTISTDGIRFAPIDCRLAWPSELDLMAQIAGLKLVDRWGGWQKQPYSGRDMHISVYKKI